MVIKHPFIKQSGPNTCAAACVWMIVKFYKGFISTVKLENMLKINSHGTTAYHIIQTLEELGFKAYGKRLTKITDTKVPFIANVIIDGSYKHFIVVYEVSKQIKIADPGNKIKTISKDEFYKIWTGVVIEMYPNNKIVKEKPQNLKKIFNFIKINKLLTLKIGFLSFLITIFSIFSSFFFQILIENQNNIQNIAILFISVFIIKNIINHIRDTKLIDLSNDIDHALTTNVYNSIINLPYIYFQNHTAGEIISRINDLKIIKEIVNAGILLLFIDIPFTLFIIPILYYLNHKLFYISLFIILFFPFIIIIYHKKIKNSVEILLKEKAETSSFMTETISNYEVIKGIDIENKIKKLFLNKYNNYINKNIKLEKTINNQNLFKNMINDISSSLILIIGIIEVQNNAMTISTLITFNFLFVFLKESIKNIINFDLEIKEGINAFNRINDIMCDQQKKQLNCNKNIDIINLSYSNILKNINLNIQKNSKVLITGPSGSGKSTFLKILKGYYNDYDGKKYINKRVVYLSKETIFAGSLKYNLTLKDNQNIKKMISLCHINEIIDNHPLGLNMFLEENGQNISTGQKQRISLGRSLYNFDVLLLDEALSGLDINLERQILKNIFKQFKNKIIIVVTHRLDNLDLFDQYIKFKNGKIILNETKRKE